MKEALYFQRAGEGAVFCRLCPRECRLQPGQRGFCRARENRDGCLVTVNYGQCSAYALDPVEKKPLYHFYPGRLIFSVGTTGCNLHCLFCQNWSIAHGTPETVTLTPERLVELAAGHPASIGIAYTYSEPTVWYEFVLETARLAAAQGLKNVLVTNGYINPEPLSELLPHLAALNIDVKGFSDCFYREVVRGEREPVLRTVELAARQCHVEVTTLLVPGKNDHPGEIEELATWLAGISPDLPLHLSRYFPRYKMDVAPTPEETLLQAREIASRHLNYVYLGNAPELNGSDTLCPRCQKTVISRQGYRVNLVGLLDGRCSSCDYPISIVQS